MMQNKLKKGDKEEEKKEGGGGRGGEGEKIKGSAEKYGNFN